AATAGRHRRRLLGSGSRGSSARPPRASPPSPAAETGGSAEGSTGLGVCVRGRRRGDTPRTAPAEGARSREAAAAAPRGGGGGSLCPERRAQPARGFLPSFLFFFFFFFSSRSLGLSVVCVVSGFESSFFSSFLGEAPLPAPSPPPPPPCPPGSSRAPRAAVALLGRAAAGARRLCAGLEYGWGNGNQGEAEAEPRLPDAADERQEADEQPPQLLRDLQLEAETGCKIMVRGKGSMRDKKKEEQNRGKPNWEHLNEDLHVLITVEDAQNRAEIKLKRAVEEVKKLLIPAAEGEDSLKKMQLMELAILNGTYRDANIKSPLAFSLAATAQAPRIITGPAPVLPPAALRTPTPAGPTIMPLIRQIQTAVMPNGTPHPTAAIVPPGPEAGLIYTPYEYPYTLAPATSILEYPIEPSGVLGMAFPTKG
uniref:QKI, KH domain containing RNA binding n=1 Tax=Taeniopygia guttata TaxID=59729 RepID=A0A674GGY0_TAEGU